VRSSEKGGVEKSTTHRSQQARGCEQPHVSIRSPTPLPPIRCVRQRQTGRPPMLLLYYGGSTTVMVPSCVAEDETIISFITVHVLLCLGWGGHIAFLFFSF
jgi:hypothetical protein